MLISGRAQNDWAEYIFRFIIAALQIYYFLIIYFLN